MGVYIKGMKMQTSCYKCPVRRRDGMDIVCPIAHERFSVAGVDILHYRLDDCPLAPVPPHGRLIDADAPIKVWEVKLSDGDSCSFRNIETTVSKFLLSHLMGEVPPTIIPAEEGE